ncbi:hypothetical protein BDY17DRAFT_308428 [Neohortaea acidophila]|uniref:DUF6697 domain-containing protein n=1 Tax=Neohortaea acidophila TaxID=245834 RepID=A0A6A6Q0L5_9PEZI|nr:uncharacterized protein BDY17DRAFT_308428 [Neohortaea acidophila]KAF2484957.1 hypothetical protein BDY17DRAFT_308428 [Neohortaea acidophila]
MSLIDTNHWSPKGINGYSSTRNNTLNPSTQPFMPNGTEMQRYQPAMQNNNLAPPADALQLRNIMLDHHFSHTRDITGLERRTRQNTDQIQSFAKSAHQDMRAVQAQIEELKQQMAMQTQHSTSMITHHSLADQDVTPPAELLRNFSKERIAEAYLEEAEDYEAAAAKLREQAETLCSGRVAAKNILKLPSTAQEDERASQAKEEFVCCGIAYDSGEQLLKHAKAAHSSDGELHSPAVDIQHPNPKQADRVKVQAILRTPAPSEPFEKEVKEEFANSEWKPLAIRQMPSTKAVIKPNTESFTFDFLQNNLGGSEWSPGFYFIRKNSILPSQSYWILEGDFEPFLPSIPGQHGAKLTALFNSTIPKPGEGPDEENFEDVPIFIRSKGDDNGEYTYYGHYSQRRFSDKLDYDRVMESIPKEILKHHAKELAAMGRPQWVTEELRNHFWPRPEYTGPIPTDSQVATPKTEATANTDADGGMPERHVLTELTAYAEMLKKWNRESTMRVSHLSEENIMQAFGKADAAEEPGLRLWLEYLQFETYDHKFCEFLVELKRNPSLQVDALGLSMKKGPRFGGGKMVKPTNGIETVHPGSSSTVKAPTAYSTPFEDWKKGATEVKTLDQPPKSTRSRKGTNATREQAKKKTAPSPVPAPSTGWVASSSVPETVPAANGLSGAASMPQGEIEMAKQLQEEYKQRMKGQGAGGRRGGGEGKKVPPHLRGRRGDVQ